MPQLLDIVAIAIVVACAVYALRALLPRSLLVRITGNADIKKFGCGGCNSCDTAKKSTGDGCH